MSPQYLTAATTIMDVTYSVFLKTASNTYPSVNFGQGTPAKFKFEYDPATSPYFSGKVITDSNGDPIFGNDGNLVLNTTIEPFSPLSNYSEYSIAGNISLEIGSSTWSGSQFDLTINNNFPYLTPLDRMSFVFDLIPNSSSAERLQKVELSLSSNSRPLSFVRNTALPTHNSDIDISDIESVDFSLRLLTGGWFINSGFLTSISVTTIPEVSSFLLIWISSVFGVFRRIR